MGVMDNGVAMEIGVELVNSAVCIHVRGIAYCVSGYLGVALYRE